MAGKEEGAHDSDRTGRRLALPHVLILILVIGSLALWVGALVSIGASKASGAEKAIWILVALLFPFVGSIAWFVFGRRAQGHAGIERI
ncbi:MAG: PLDc_N domain-containing protein [Microbacterium sp.]|uniref:PLD nuclease N-terminal domain-containing protein n=1 Tax=Microbacterium sp. TaxID=51671 RepID=UPI001AD32B01|nr:PLD nuclease N-terminal domain-containing protein [Microbacterium sp.]MBN9176680.1 PLDc_N domain-containing protein [Microbacterium sp.]